MAFSKLTWKDRIVQYANRYTKSGETATEVTLVRSPGVVTENGTAVNAANLNRIEQGIADALPKDGSEAMTGKILAPFGINANLPDNYRVHGDLPSTYPQGVSTFFANNAGAWAGGAVYGTVQTIKGFIGQTSMTQYFLPYLTDTPIKYRNGLFGADTWTEWRTLWDTSQLRDNAGVLEFFTGGEWRPVGGVKSIQRGTVAVNTKSSTVVNVPISAVNIAKSSVNIQPFSFTSIVNTLFISLQPNLTSTNIALTPLNTNLGYDGALSFSWEVIEYY